jgi:hypothetical protein
MALSLFGDSFGDSLAPFISGHLSNSLSNSNYGLRSLPLDISEVHPNTEAMSTSALLLSTSTLLLSASAKQGLTARVPEVP